MSHSSVLLHNYSFQIGNSVLIATVASTQQAFFLVHCVKGGEGKLGRHSAVEGKEKAAVLNNVYCTERVGLNEVAKRLND